MKRPLLKSYSSAAPTIIVVVAFAHYTLIAKKPLTAAVAFVRELSILNFQF
jgi:hypothetical protein